MATTNLVDLLVVSARIRHLVRLLAAPTCTHALKFGMRDRTTMLAPTPSPALRIGTMLSMMKDITALIFDKKVLIALLWVFTDLNVDILLATTTSSSTGVSMNLGSGVVKTICGLRFVMVWRRPAGSVESGLVAMASSFAVGIFAGINRHLPLNLSMHIHITHINTDLSVSFS